MILEKQTEAHILEEGQSQETTKMSLDLDSAQVLMQMLSKNLYSDAIGSTIRECASNALDSHRRAGCDKPIVVSFKRNTKADIYEFAVEDFGTGLDADDVVNIISKYGKSTKRNSNTELGMMGLGFKAPLAYSSSFYFVCRKDGIERKYMMYEGEDTNSIDLLYETPTTECNGVKVIVPVPYGDRYNFANKTKEQLAYFESVYFDFDSSIGGTVNNDFTIYRSEHFQFSGLSTNNYMHLCLDNVSYPIDWDKLGISRIGIPIALRFSLSDGLFPTPNREALRYTQEAKQTILNKLKEVANVYMDKFNETIKDSDDVQAVLNFYSERNRSIPDFVGGRGTIYIDELLKHATTPMAKAKITGIEKLDLERVADNLKAYMLGEYHLKYRYSNGRFIDAKNYYSTVLHINDLQKDRYGYGDVYVFTETLTVQKKNYLRSLLGEGHATHKFVKPIAKFTLGTKQTDYSTYRSMLALDKYPVNEWRQLITEYKQLIKLLTNTFIDADAIEVPETWIAEQKAKRIKVAQVNIASGTKRVRLAGELSAKIATDLQVYVSGQTCKFVPKVFQMNKLHQCTKLMVYGTEEQRKELDELYLIFKKHVSFAVVAKASFENLEKAKLHNWINLNKFMEGKNKPFARMATVLMINRFISDYSEVFGKSARISLVSKDLGQKVENLITFTRNNRGAGSSNREDIIIDFAIANKIVDMEIYPTYLEVKAVFSKLPFLKPLFNNIPSYISKSNEGLTPMLADLFKYYKQKVNLEHYKFPVMNEDLPLEEVLTEEVVNDLQII